MFYLKNYRIIHYLMILFMYIGFIYLIEFDEILLENLFSKTSLLFISLFNNEYLLKMTGLNDKYVNDKIFLNNKKE